MNRTLKAMAALMLMMIFAVGCNKPDEPNNGEDVNNKIIVPTVETSLVYDISETMAIVRGVVTSGGGGNVIERGVCWNTTTNPTVNGIHVCAETGTEVFSCALSNLEPNTVYYIRAYAINEKGVGYGNEMSFTTLEASVETPEGAVTGLFSVNERLQVFFSKGNLQYQASTNTWRFAENQWDFVGTQLPEMGNTGGTVHGSDNVGLSNYYSGWIDLFGWGTSGYDHGAICFQPWSNSQEDSHYYAYGKWQYGLQSETGKADWGYNPISNGGNQINVWRTLTIDEWAYLFNSRSTNSGIRFAKAQVVGVNGVVLLPDTWDNTNYSFNSFNQKGASFSSNVIDSVQWGTLQETGAVFLPITGFRRGLSVYHVTSMGLYWSSTRGVDMGFDNIGISTSTNSNFGNRSYGYAVRLICPAK